MRLLNCDLLNLGHLLQFGAFHFSHRTRFFLFLFRCLDPFDLLPPSLHINLLLLFHHSINLFNLFLYPPLPLSSLSLFLLSLLLLYHVIQLRTEKRIRSFKLDSLNDPFTVFFIVRRYHEFCFCTFLFTLLEYTPGNEYIIVDPLYISVLLK